MNEPLLCLSTQHADGSADVSPRGDPAGFVSVIDSKTLAIPPGFDDTLRVNGRAFLSRDPDLLSSMVVKDRTPTLAVVVEVREAFLHCAKAFRRARLWQADALQDRKNLPSLAASIGRRCIEVCPRHEVVKRVMASAFEKLVQGKSCYYCSMTVQTVA